MYCLEIIYHKTPKKASDIKKIDRFEGAQIESGLAFSEDQSTFLQLG